MGWKETIKKYGVRFFIYWTAVWAINGIIIFFLLEYGLIGGADAITFFKLIHLDSFVSLESIDPTLSNMVLAYVINEVLEIVRFPIVVSTFMIFNREIKRLKKDV